MAKSKKTVYEIQRYSLIWGWEKVTQAYSKAEAESDLKDYRFNDRKAKYRIVKK